MVDISIYLINTNIAYTSYINIIIVVVIIYLFLLLHIIIIIIIIIIIKNLYIL